MSTVLSPAPRLVAIRPLRPTGPGLISHHPVHVARRRRVLMASVGSVLVAVALIAVLLGRVPASAPEQYPDKSTMATHLVQPGETLWSIAERSSPSIGISAYVDLLVRVNGGSTIRVGQELLLP